jgi:DNA-binding LacI/PurR family transcriptional regulator
MLVPSLRNPLYAELVRGAFDRAWERGYVVVLFEDTGAKAATMAYERLVDEGRIDGVLVASAYAGSPTVALFSQGDLPCVFVGRQVPGTLRNVTLREEDAGAQAAAHFVSLGHTRLGHLAGPQLLDTAVRMARGFERVCGDAGVEHTTIYASGDERSGFAAMRRLLVGERSPTAIFVSHLSLAVGALAAARSVGRAVPNELSIVCYDDPILEYLDPAVTAVRMPLHELGSAAVDRLVASTKGSPIADVEVKTSPQLIVRSSTASPNDRRP